VRWEVEKETFVGDNEALGYVTRRYRAPWKLPSE
jgi:hypothetical protein